MATGGKRDPVSHRTPAQIRKMDHGYNARPEQIQKRSNNNRARQMLGLKKGDPRDADHIKPQRHGGPTTRGNLRAIHKSKNRGWRDGVR